MAIEQYEFAVTKDKIPHAAHEYHAEFGARITFEGVVRGLEGERVISGIDYSCYSEMLQAKADRLFEHGRTKFGGHWVSMIHRLGFVPVTEPSVRIEVSRRNSEECFEICRWYLRALKEELPIWKKPIFASKDAS